MRLFRPGILAGCLYPDVLFRVKTTQKILYLTFDDGPDPGSTPRLLNILSESGVRALFFCSGKAAEKYPHLVRQIRTSGHQVGNHGYNHYDGWRTRSGTYADDVNRAASFTSDIFFRPPYGRLSLSQKKLLGTYKIIFWDVMAYDFDKSFGRERSLRVLTRKMRPGSIIVLHDTASSCTNEIIANYLESAFKEGYRFELIF